MTLANANALYQGLKSQPSFTQTIHIRPGDPEDRILMGARGEIRNALREAFGDFRKYLKDSRIREALFENRDQDFRAAAQAIQQLDIRFLTQGSRAYGTLIRRARPKTQQIDLDDGVYLPMPFVNDAPVFASAALFAVIEEILTPLVEKHGWRFKQKDTCLRIEMPEANAHIDLPLFAVRKSSFVTLTDAYEKQTGHNVRKARNLNESFDQEAKSLRLEQADILLAHREKDWLPSDPKEIHDWFINQVERYGPVLRRTSRYAKAWRDLEWEKCGLSSIALMIACRDCIADLNQRPSDGRDDLIMLCVAERLSTRLRQGNLCWKEGADAVCVDWSDEDREAYAAAAERFAAELNAALNETTHPEVVVRRLRNAFGERFPYAPESVSIEQAAQTAEVMETKAARNPMPLVGTSVSG